MSNDPRQLMFESPMSPLQGLVIAITFALNALDGFDVLSISFAAPGIAEEWGIDRAALGIVLSMELIGMSVGSILLGGIADTLGRRVTILVCLAVMATGMFMVTMVSGLIDLSIWRVITGIGIGGMIASINAVAAEFSNARRMHLCVSLMVIGYPVGAVIGGTVAAQLLTAYDWRSVFYLGTGMTVACIPLVYLFVPESVHWLSRKQPAGALEKINSALRRMGHAAVAALPAVSPETRRRSVRDIFEPGLLAITIIITSAYFFHIVTFYFVVKWVPKIVVDMGFAASSAAAVLVWTNVGGALGGALLGLLTMRYRVKSLTVGVLVLSALMVVLFGRSPAELDRLATLCALAGFCINAGIVGLYASIAHAYPAYVRAFGTGFVVGLGRGGSLLAPIIAGFLFEAGIGLPTVAAAMAGGSVLAAAVLLFLPLKPGD